MCTQLYNGGGTNLVGRGFMWHNLLNSHLVCSYEADLSYFEIWWHAPSWKRLDAPPFFFFFFCVSLLKQIGNRWTVSVQHLEARWTCWPWFSSFPRSTLESNKKGKKNCLRTFQHINTSIPTLNYVSLSWSDDDIVQSQRLMDVCVLAFDLFNRQM